MKILIITKSIDRRSGIGRYSYEVCRALEKSGANIVIAAEKFDEPIGKGILLGRLSLLSFFKNAAKLRFGSLDYDAVHVLEAWPYGLYGLAAVLGREKKFFVTAVGTYSIAPLLHKGIKRFLLMRVYRRATKIFAISNFVRKRVRALARCPLPITTIFLGVNKLPSINMDRAKEFKLRFGLAEAHPIFLTVGQIKDRKGQLDTFHGLALLKKEYPNFLYIMIGGDQNASYISSIKKFAAENGLESNYKIISNVADDEEIAFFYQLCDVFLLNSNNDDKHGHYEGFGLVCLEAAQFGKPCIGSKNCGIEDAIENGYNGYLTEQRDAEEICRCVRRVLSRIDEMSTHSLEFSRRFSWMRTSQLLLAHYEE